MQLADQKNIYNMEKTNKKTPNRFWLFLILMFFCVLDQISVCSPNTFPAIQLFTGMNFFFNLQHSDKFLMWDFVSRALYSPN